MYVFFRIPSMRIFLQSGKTSWGSSKGCCLFAARDLYEPSTLLKKARPSVKPQVFEVCISAVVSTTMLQQSIVKENRS